MKIRVFISSVQKELADERLALQILLTTDPFLSEHCVPVLFENEPAPLEPNPWAYLELLENCHVYLAIVWKEYGVKIDGLSATHHEYRKAQEERIPSLITIKGTNTLERENEAQDFIAEIRRDGHTCDRFHTTEELQQKVRTRLIRHIKEQYHVGPTSEQENIARQNIQVASAFERQRLDRISWQDLDHGLAAMLAAKAEETEPGSLTSEKIISILWTRGLLWKAEQNQFLATAAGIILLANDPSAIFPHTRLQMSAFAGKERTHKPIDHGTIRKPLAKAIDDAVAFVHRNTRHPLRVVGLNRVELNEYPEEALREALVNALAHRDYEDAGRRVTLDLFRDRLEITSPGELPGGLSLARLRSGQARSRSRNPNIAQGLVLLGRMEERGTGIQRMMASMLDHGLDKPVINLIDGEVTVTLFGPGEDLERIKTPSNVPGIVSPAMEAKLNDRQKAIIRKVLTDGSVTSGWVMRSFGVVKDTAARDLKELCNYSLLEQKGRGRSVHYILPAKK